MAQINIPKNVDGFEAIAQVKEVLGVVIATNSHGQQRAILPGDYIFEDDVVDFKQLVLFTPEEFNQHLLSLEEQLLNDLDEQIAAEKQEQLAKLEAEKKAKSDADEEKSEDDKKLQEDEGTQFTVIEHRSPLFGDGSDGSSLQARINQLLDEQNHLRFAKKVVDSLSKTDGKSYADSDVFVDLSVKPRETFESKLQFIQELTLAKLDGLKDTPNALNNYYQSITKVVDLSSIIQTLFDAPKDGKITLSWPVIVGSGENLQIIAAGEYNKSEFFKELGVNDLKSLGQTLDLSQIPTHGLIIPNVNPLLIQEGFLKIGGLSEKNSQDVLKAFENHNTDQDIDFSVKITADSLRTHAKDGTLVDDKASILYDQQLVHIGVDAVATGTKILSDEILNGAFDDNFSNNKETVFGNLNTIIPIKDGPLNGIAINFASFFEDIDGSESRELTIKLPEGMGLSSWSYGGMLTSDVSLNNLQAGEQKYSILEQLQENGWRLNESQTELTISLDGLSAASLHSLVLLNTPENFERMHLTGKPLQFEMEVRTSENTTDLESDSKNNQLVQRFIFSGEDGQGFHVPESWLNPANTPSVDNIITTTVTDLDGHIISISKTTTDGNGNTTTTIETKDSNGNTTTTSVIVRDETGVVTKETITDGNGNEVINKNDIPKTWVEIDNYDPSQPHGPSNTPGVIVTTVVTDIKTKEVISTTTTSTNPDGTTTTNITDTTGTTTTTVIDPDGTTTTTVTDPNGNIITDNDVDNNAAGNNSDLMGSFSLKEYANNTDYNPLSVNLNTMWNLMKPGNEGGSQLFDFSSLKENGKGTLKITLTDIADPKELPTLQLQGVSPNPVFVKVGDAYVYEINLNTIDESSATALRIIPSAFDSHDFKVSVDVVSTDTTIPGIKLLSDSVVHVGVQAQGMYYTTEDETNKSGEYTFALDPQSIEFSRNNSVSFDLVITPYLQDTDGSESQTIKVYLPTGGDKSVATWSLNEGGAGWQLGNDTRGPYVEYHGPVQNETALKIPVALDGNTYAALQAGKGGSFNVVWDTVDQDPDSSSTSRVTTDTANARDGSGGPGISIDPGFTNAPKGLAISEVQDTYQESNTIAVPLGELFTQIKYLLNGISPVITAKIADAKDTSIHPDSDTVSGAANRVTKEIGDINNRLHEIFDKLDLKVTQTGINGAVLPITLRDDNGHKYAFDVGSGVNGVSEYSGDTIFKLFKDFLTSGSPADYSVRLEPPAHSSIGFDLSFEVELGDITASALTPVGTPSNEIKSYANIPLPAKTVLDTNPAHVTNLTTVRSTVEAFNDDAGTVRVSIDTVATDVNAKVGLVTAMYTEYARGVDAQGDLKLIEKSVPKELPLFQIKDDTVHMPLAFKLYVPERDGTESLKVKFTLPDGDSLLKAKDIGKVDFVWEMESPNNGWTLQNTDGVFTIERNVSGEALLLLDKLSSATSDAAKEAIRLTAKADILQEIEGLQLDANNNLISNIPLAFDRDLLGNMVHKPMNIGMHTEISDIPGSATDFKDDNIKTSDQQFSFNYDQRFLDPTITEFSFDPETFGEQELALAIERHQVIQVDLRAMIKQIDEQYQALKTQRINENGETIKSLAELEQAQAKFFENTKIVFETFTSGGKFPEGKAPIAFFNTTPVELEVTDRSLSASGPQLKALYESIITDPNWEDNLDSLPKLYVASAPYYDKDFSINATSYVNGKLDNATLLLDTTNYTVDSQTQSALDLELGGARQVSVSPRMEFETIAKNENPALFDLAGNNAQSMRAVKFTFDVSAQFPDVDGSESHWIVIKLDTSKLLYPPFDAEGNEHPKAGLPIGDDFEATSYIFQKEDSLWDNYGHGVFARRIDHNTQEEFDESFSFEVPLAMVPVAVQEGHSSLYKYDEFGNQVLKNGQPVLADDVFGIKFDLASEDAGFSQTGVRDFELNQFDNIDTTHIEKTVRIETIGIDERNNNDALTNQQRKDLASDEGQWKVADVSFEGALEALWQKFSAPLSRLESTYGIDSKFNVLEFIKNENQAEQSIYQKLLDSKIEISVGLIDKLHLPDGYFESVDANFSYDGNGHYLLTGNDLATALVQWNRGEDQIITDIDGNLHTVPHLEPTMYFRTDLYSSTDFSVSVKAFEAASDKPFYNPSDVLVIVDGEAQAVNPQANPVGSTHPTGIETHLSFGMGSDGELNGQADLNVQVNINMLDNDGSEDVEVTLTLHGNLPFEKLLLLQAENSNAIWTQSLSQPNVFTARVPANAATTLSDSFLLRGKTADFISSDAQGGSVSGEKITFDMRIVTHEKIEDYQVHNQSSDPNAVLSTVSTISTQRTPAGVINVAEKTHDYLVDVRSAFKAIESQLKNIKSTEVAALEALKTAKDNGDSAAATKLLTEHPQLSQYLDAQGKLTVTFPLAKDFFTDGASYSINLPNDLQLPTNLEDNQTYTIQIKLPKESEMLTEAAPQDLNFKWVDSNTDAWKITTQAGQSTMDITLKAADITAFNDFQSSITLAKVWYNQQFLDNPALKAADIKSFSDIKALNDFLVDLSTKTTIAEKSAYTQKFLSDHPALKAADIKAFSDIKALNDFQVDLSKQITAVQSEATQKFLTDHPTLKAADLKALNDFQVDLSTKTTVAEKSAYTQKFLSDHPALKAADITAFNSFQADLSKQITAETAEYTQKFLSDHPALKAADITAFNAFKENLSSQTAASKAEYTQQFLKDHPAFNNLIDDSGHLAVKLPISGEMRQYVDESNDALKNVSITSTTSAKAGDAVKITSKDASIEQDIRTADDIRYTLEPSATLTGYKFPTALANQYPLNFQVNLDLSEIHDSRSVEVKIRLPLDTEMLSGSDLLGGLDWSLPAGSGWRIVDDSYVVKEFSAAEIKQLQLMQAENNTTMIDFPTLQYNFVDERAFDLRNDLVDASEAEASKGSTEEKSPFTLSATGNALEPSDHEPYTNALGFSVDVDLADVSATQSVTIRIDLPPENSMLNSQTVTADSSFEWKVSDAGSGWTIDAANHQLVKVLSQSEIEALKNESPSTDVAGIKVPLAYTSQYADDVRKIDKLSFDYTATKQEAPIIQTYEQSADISENHFAFDEKSDSYLDKVKLTFSLEHMQLIGQDNTSGELPTFDIDKLLEGLNLSRENGNLPAGLVVVNSETAPSITIEGAALKTVLAEWLQLHDAHAPITLLLDGNDGKPYYFNGSLQYDDLAVGNETTDTHVVNVFDQVDITKIGQETIAAGAESVPYSVDLTNGFVELYKEYVEPHRGQLAFSLEDQMEVLQSRIEQTLGQNPSAEQINNYLKNMSIDLRLDYSAYQSKPATLQLIKHNDLADSVYGKDATTGSVTELKLIQTSEFISVPVASNTRSVLIDGIEVFAKTNARGEKYIEVRDSLYQISGDDLADIYHTWSAGGAGDNNLASVLINGYNSKPFTLDTSIINTSAVDDRGNPLSISNLDYTIDDTRTGSDRGNLLIFNDMIDVLHPELSASSIAVKLDTPRDLIKPPEITDEKFEKVFLGKEINEKGESVNVYEYQLKGADFETAFDTWLSQAMTDRGGFNAAAKFSTSVEVYQTQDFTIDARVEHGLGPDRENKGLYADTIIQVGARDDILVSEPGREAFNYVKEVGEGEVKKVALDLSEAFKLLAEKFVVNGGFSPENILNSEIRISIIGGGKEDGEGPAIVSPGMKKLDAAAGNSRLGFEEWVMTNPDAGKQGQTSSASASSHNGTLDIIDRFQKWLKASGDQKEIIQKEAATVELQLNDHRDEDIAIRYKLTYADGGDPVAFRPDQFVVVDAVVNGVNKDSLALEVHPPEFLQERGLSGLFKVSYTVKMDFPDQDGSENHLIQLEIYDTDGKLINIPFKIFKDSADEGWQRGPNNTIVFDPEKIDVTTLENGHFEQTLDLRFDIDDLVNKGYLERSTDGSIRQLNFITNVKVTSTEDTAGLQIEELKPLEQSLLKLPSETSVKEFLSSSQNEHTQTTIRFSSVNESLVEQTTVDEKAVPAAQRLREYYEQHDLAPAGLKTESDSEIGIVNIANIYSKINSSSKELLKNDQWFDIQKVLNDLKDYKNTHTDAEFSKLKIILSVDSLNPKALNATLDLPGVKQNSNGDWEVSAKALLDTAKPLPGLQADYYNGSITWPTAQGASVSASPLATKLDSQINHPTTDTAFGSSASMPGITDMFSARWTGQLLADTTGKHQFQIQADSGSTVEVWIDGTKVITGTVPGVAPASGVLTSASAGINFTADTKHSVEVRYVDSNGGKNDIVFQWKQPGETAFSAVPTDNLFAPENNPFAPNVDPLHLIVNTGNISNIGVAVLDENRKPVSFEHEDIPVPVIMNVTDHTIDLQNVFEKVRDGDINLNDATIRFDFSSIGSTALPAYFEFVVDRDSDGKVTEQYYKISLNNLKDEYQDWLEAQSVNTTKANSTPALITLSDDVTFVSDNPVVKLTYTNEYSLDAKSEIKFNAYEELETIQSGQLETKADSGDLAIARHIQQEYYPNLDAAIATILSKAGANEASYITGGSLDTARQGSTTGTTGKYFTDFFKITFNLNGSHATTLNLANAQADFANLAKAYRAAQQASPGVESERAQKAYADETKSFIQKNAPQLIIKIDEHDQDGNTPWSAPVINYQVRDTLASYTQNSNNSATNQADDFWQTRPEAYTTPTSPIPSSANDINVSRVSTTVLKNEGSSFVKSEAIINFEPIVSTLLAKLNPDLQAQYITGTKVNADGSVDKWSPDQASEKGWTIDTAKDSSGAQKAFTDLFKVDITINGTKVTLDLGTAGGATGFSELARAYLVEQSILNNPTSSALDKEQAKTAFQLETKEFLNDLKDAGSLSAASLIKVFSNTYETFVVNKIEVIDKLKSLVQIDGGTAESNDDKWDIGTVENKQVVPTSASADAVNVVDYYQTTLDLKSVFAQITNSTHEKIIVTIEPENIPTPNGLQAEYYNSLVSWPATATAPGTLALATRLDTQVNSAGATEGAFGDGQIAGLGANFSARWTGQLLADKSATSDTPYQLQVKADVGSDVEVWINGEKIVGLSGTVPATGLLTFSSWVPPVDTDKKYDIEVRYKDVNGGSDGISLNWKEPGATTAAPFAAIPSANLTPPDKFSQAFKATENPNEWEVRTDKGSLYKAWEVAPTDPKTGEKTGVYAVDLLVTGDATTHVANNITLNYEIQKSEHITLDEYNEAMKSGGEGIRYAELESGKGSFDLQDIFKAISDNSDFDFAGSTLKVSFNSVPLNSPLPSYLSVVETSGTKTLTIQMDSTVIKNLYNEWESHPDQPAVLPNFTISSSTLTDVSASLLYSDGYEATNLTSDMQMLLNNFDSLVATDGKRFDNGTKDGIATTPLQQQLWDVLSSNYSDNQAQFKKFVIVFESSDPAGPLDEDLIAQAVYVSPSKPNDPYSWLSDIKTVHAPLEAGEESVPNNRYAYEVTLDMKEYQAALEAARADATKAADKRNDPTTTDAYYADGDPDKFLNDFSTTMVNSLFLPVREGARLSNLSIQAVNEENQMIDPLTGRLTDVRVTYDDVPLGTAFTEYGKAMGVDLGNILWEALEAIADNTDGVSSQVLNSTLKLDTNINTQLVFGRNTTKDWPQDDYTGSNTNVGQDAQAFQKIFGNMKVTVPGTDNEKILANFTPQEFKDLNPNQYPLSLIYPYTTDTVDKTKVGTASVVKDEKNSEEWFVSYDTKFVRNHELKGELLKVLVSEVEKILDQGNNGAADKAEFIKNTLGLFTLQAPPKTGEDEHGNTDAFVLNVKTISQVVHDTAIDGGSSKIEYKTDVILPDTFIDIVPTENRSLDASSNLSVKIDNTFEDTLTDASGNVLRVADEMAHTVARSKMDLNLDLQFVNRSSELKHGIVIELPRYYEENGARIEYNWSFLNSPNTRESLQGDSTTSQGGRPWNLLDDPTEYKESVLLHYFFPATTDGRITDTLSLTFDAEVLVNKGNASLAPIQDQIRLYTSSTSDDKPANYFDINNAGDIGLLAVDSSLVPQDIIKDTTFITPTTLNLKNDSYTAKAGTEGDDNFRLTDESKNTSLFTGKGNDTVYGGDGSDVIIESRATAAGNDYVVLGGGADIAATGSGNDVVYANGDKSSNTADEQGRSYFIFEGDTLDTAQSVNFEIHFEIKQFWSDYYKSYYSSASFSDFPLVTSTHQNTVLVQGADGKIEKRATEIVDLISTGTGDDIIYTHNPNVDKYHGAFVLAGQGKDTIVSGWGSDVINLSIANGLKMITKQPILTSDFWGEGASSIGSSRSAGDKLYDFLTSMGVSPGIIGQIGNGHYATGLTGYFGDGGHSNDVFDDNSGNVRDALNKFIAEANKLFDDKYTGNAEQLVDLKAYNEDLNTLNLLKDYSNNWDEIEGTGQKYAALHLTSGDDAMSSSDGKDTNLQQSDKNADVIRYYLDSVVKDVSHDNQQDFAGENRSFDTIYYFDTSKETGDKIDLSGFFNELFKTHHQYEVAEQEKIDTLRSQHATEADIVKAVSAMRFEFIKVVGEDFDNDLLQVSNKDRLSETDATKNTVSDMDVDLHEARTAKSARIIVTDPENRDDSQTTTTGNSDDMEFRYDIALLVGVEANQMKLDNFILYTPQDLQ